MFEKNSRYCSVATLKQIPLGPLWTKKTGILSVEERVTQAERDGCDWCCTHHTQLESCLKKGVGQL